METQDKTKDVKMILYTEKIAIKDQKCKEPIFKEFQIKFINQLIKLKNTNTNIILLKKRSLK
jgi:hypothetical protein